MRVRYKTPLTIFRKDYEQVKKQTKKQKDLTCIIKRYFLCPSYIVISSSRFARLEGFLYVC